MSEFDEVLGDGAQGAPESAGPPLPRKAPRRGGSSSAAKNSTPQEPEADDALTELGEMLRASAIAHGRALGEHEAIRAGEEGAEREQRIARAMAYAAWEADGKPEGKGADYRAEFGITGHDVVSADDRAPYRLLLSEVKDKKDKKS